jgi:hypothetical protein
MRSGSRFGLSGDGARLAVDAAADVIRDMEQPMHGGMRLQALAHHVREAWIEELHALNRRDRPSVESGSYSRAAAFVERQRLACKRPLRPIRAPSAGAVPFALRASQASPRLSRVLGYPTLPMFWAEEVAARCRGAQIINDSKTPSGRVHVGALRGVLIHDAIFRTLREKGIEARYLFGVDDYDPLDEIPAGKGEHFERYLGQPLCNVPPPDNSPASDMAEHYISEFFEIFKELGVSVETYRMRDVYRSGQFNGAIEAILRAAPAVRRVYKEVSNSDRPETWFPFNVICEQCGRIGTTEVFASDGAQVSYRCRPDMVKWARGCGHEGQVSPYDGRGKLPWKLEWVAKWVSFPVTIEGAGKDHSTKGGSRDVAVACLREIFGKEAPLNVPYEFFLVGGAKMSSSRGVGASARDIAKPASTRGAPLPDDPDEAELPGELRREGGGDHQALQRV